MMMKVSVYTRNRNCENYPFGLASAVHFSAQMEGETVMMNRN